MNTAIESTRAEEAETVMSIGTIEIIGIEDMREEPAESTINAKIDIVEIMNFDAVENGIDIAENTIGMKVDTAENMISMKLEITESMIGMRVEDLREKNIDHRDFKMSKRK